MQYAILLGLLVILALLPFQFSVIIELANFSYCLRLVPVRLLKKYLFDSYISLITPQIPTVSQLNFWHLGSCWFAEEVRSSLTSYIISQILVTHITFPLPNLNRDYSFSQDNLCDVAHCTIVVQRCSYTACKLCNLHLHCKCVCVWCRVNECEESESVVL